MRLRGQRVKKTIETENTLLLILSEGHSLSIQFRASRLPHFSSAVRNRLLQNTHTHTDKYAKEKTKQYTCLAHSYTQITQPKCKTIRKRKTKQSNLPFQLFLQCILGHDKLYVQTGDEKRQQRSHCLWCLPLPCSFTQNSSTRAEPQQLLCCV